MPHGWLDPWVMPGDGGLDPGTGDATWVARSLGDARFVLLLLLLCCYGCCVVIACVLLFLWCCSNVVLYSLLVNAAQRARWIRMAVWAAFLSYQFYLFRIMLLLLLV